MGVHNIIPTPVCAAKLGAIRAPTIRLEFRWGSPWWSMFIHSFCTPSVLWVLPKSPHFRRAAKITASRAQAYTVGRFSWESPDSPRSESCWWSLAVSIRCMYLFTVLTRFFFPLAVTVLATVCPYCWPFVGIFHIYCRRFNHSTSVVFLTDWIYGSWNPHACVVEIKYIIHPTYVYNSFFHWVLKKGPSLQLRMPFTRFVLIHGLLRSSWRVNVYSTNEKHKIQGPGVRSPDGKLQDD